jgi:hypothetical protein
MSADVFEKNVEAMIRRAALRPDEAAAKERFLRELDAPEERRSWKFAAAAAAILIAVTIVWSAKSGRPLDGTTGQSSTTPKPPAPEPWSGHPLSAEGGNELLIGGFVLRGKLRPPKVIFTARDADRTRPGAFPEGTLFSVRVQRLSEKVQEGRLVPYARETIPGSEEFRKGEVSTQWEYRGPELVVVDLFISEALQERDIVKALRVPESQRTCFFGGSLWNLDVLWRLESQYPEAAEFVRELRGFVGRVEESCASEALFKSRLQALVAEAEKIQSRASTFGKKSLFPASMGVVEFAARDLSVSMPLFTWEDGKFAGPKSYHTGNKLANTFRGDPFGFEAYRRYLDEAALAAGREFLLWIVRDAKVSGLEEAHRKLLRDHALKPGVEDFAQRMLRLDQVGNDPRLEGELRVLKK